MKDVILIGLGEFGKRTVELFQEIEAERKEILTSESRDKINVYSLVYEEHSHFNYTQASMGITKLVDSSDSKKGKKPFSYVFVGDLYEDITSDYALDYAMIPLILEKDNILLRDKDNALGFFTFSDRLESQLKCSSRKMTSILNFFKRIEKASETGRYNPEYKNISGNKIGEIICPGGPFSRNYIVVTPGDENSVLNMTSRIFAERIFYELYYLLDEYKKDYISASLTERRRCFSSFTMVQISRLAELQRYYLTYCLEESVSTYLLRDAVRGTHLDALETKFLSMLYIIERSEESSCIRNEDEYKIEFPIDRAVSLFKDKFKSKLKNIIPFYITQRYKDEREYVEICKRRVSEKLYELKPYYDDFVKSELSHMHGEFEKGYISLFKVDKLIGNIQSYIKYISDLKNIFDSWTENLTRQYCSIEEIDISNDYETVHAKIKKYQKSYIYKLPFFRPVRKILIRNALMDLSASIEFYLSNEIKRNLVASFLEQWKDDSLNSVSPVHVCKVFMDDLNVMKERLIAKKEIFSHKKEFISAMPNHYYIISQLGQEDYKNLLDKIYDREFGPAKQFSIESIARNLFNKWTSKGEGISKDRQDITKNPTGFINHIDEYLSETAEEKYKTVDINADDFERYASSAKQMLEDKVGDLSHNSFITKDTESYSAENKLLFSPVFEAEDEIDECLLHLPPETKRMKVNKDFTMGAVVYFQDYLYMEYKSLCHYENLFKKYENDREAELVYTEPDTYCDEDAPILFYRDENDVPEDVTLKKQHGCEKTCNHGFINDEIESADKNSASLENYTVDEKNNIEAFQKHQINHPSSFVDDDELDIYNLHSRMLLNDFFDEDFRLEQYNKIFGESVTELSAGNINAIAKNSDLADLLRQMNIEKIHDYCKEINFEDVFSDKETQIETILAYLEEASED